MGDAPQCGTWALAPACQRKRQLPGSRETPECLHEGPLGPGSVLGSPKQVPFLTPVLAVTFLAPSGEVEATHQVLGPCAGDWTDPLAQPGGPHVHRGVNGQWEIPPHTLPASKRRGIKGSWRGCPEGIFLTHVDARVQPTQTQVTDFPHPHARPGLDPGDQLHPSIVLAVVGTG